MGTATVLPECDFETRSEAGYLWDEAAQKYRAPRGAMKKGLPAIGAARYAEHPSTDAQLFAYDLKDGLGVRQWMPGQPNPQDLFAHVARGGLIEAHNNMFERLIWRHVMERRYGWPSVPARQWRCSMAKARAHALPGALGLIGQVLNLPLQKDKEGERLLKLFAMPRDPTIKDSRRWIEPADEPEQFAKYAAYNRTDVLAEAEASIRCPDLEGEELEFWQADQAINWRGVHIDRAGVLDCIAIVEQAHAQYNAELCALTGGTVARASELAKLKSWLGAQGVHLDVMDEDAIVAILDRMPPGPARRALEIRQAIGSASVKKVYAMANMVCADDRLHDLFSYHAARTGRPTGNGPQPTNLPKAGPTVYLCGCGRHSSPAPACAWCGVPRPPTAKPVEWCVEAVEDALAVIARRDLAEVERVFGDAMLAVSGCLRGLFTAAPFHDLIASDYTAIEAVVLAAMAGEAWRLDVFRAKRDIYLESISRSTGMLLENLLAHKTRTGSHHPLRQKGKVQELALGYGGWLGALKAFGAEGTEEEMKQQILAWRAASPAIVEFWGGQSRDFGRTPGMFGLEGAAVQAVLNPGQRQHVGQSGVSYLMHEDALYCQLPSGRYLTYHRPRLEHTGSWRGYSLSFEGYNTNPNAGAMGWVRMQTYSGKLCENVVQAVARDIQRHAIVNLERAGYPVVLHVYDEDVSEVPQGWGSIEEFESIMNRMPPWAAGWPVTASGGWRGARYRKG
jgi:DNA polymerase